MTVAGILKQIGLHDKEIQVYTTLLGLGPSPVRVIATRAKVNRGTTYDALKILIKHGLVSYYHQDKHQYFVAEDPEKIKHVISEKIQALTASQDEVQKLLPELKSIYNRAEEKPVVKFYEAATGVKTILSDVLETVANSDEREYYVYSASNIRQYLYESFPNFAKQRVKQKIRCKVIALGSGGQLWGLDERKWLSKTAGSPTYMIIYSNKLALISLNRDKAPIGMIIADRGLYQTSKFIFEHLWNSLP